MHSLRYGFTFLFVVGLGLLLALSAVSEPPGRPALRAAVPTEAQESLRGLAEQRGFLIGTAVEPGPLRLEPAYAETIAREFNLLTSENALKMGPLRPDPDSYAFEGADALIGFAEANGMAVRGHTLVWHNQLPDWLLARTFTRDELLQILRDHITTVVGRYKGRILAWDVVNEAVLDDGTLRPNVFLQTIGPEYIELAFQWAHEADPDALLFYNDFNGEGGGVKSDAIYALVKGLVEKGVPIHGVGLQMHVSSEFAPSADDVAANIDRLAELGLQVQITEMDVSTSGDPAEWGAQAELFATMLQVCLNKPACTAFVTWGFTDRVTWLGSATTPLLFDDEYRAKPAYWALYDTLKTATR